MSLYGLPQPTEMCGCHGCVAPADLSTSNVGLTTALQQAAIKQAATEAELADTKAHAEVVAKDLQKSRQAAETAAEEASAAKEELQDAQVRAPLPRSVLQHDQQHAPAQP
jgi:hypothetical protein